MLKTAEIDRFEKFACPKPAGAVKASVALTVIVHALILGGLATIGFYVVPAIVETAELEAVFSPPATRQADVSLVESVAKEKPLRSEAATDFQIRELPNDPTRLEIPEVVLEPIEPELPEISSDFLPPKEPPSKPETTTPPKKKNSPQTTGTSSRNTQTRPAAKPRPAVFSKATVRSTSRPSYPESARRKGIQGTANIRLSLDQNGKVTGASISKSSGNSALDASALRAAKRWKFRPATSGGRPIPSHIVVPISFRLN